MLSWAAPFDNYLPISGFELQAQTKDGNEWYEICQEEWFACRISMIDLRAEPYSYELQDLPVFRVRVFNDRGNSLYSELNTDGGRIQTEPSKMNAPVRDASSNQY